MPLSTRHNRLIFGLRAILTSALIFFSYNSVFSGGIKIPLTPELYTGNPEDSLYKARRGTFISQEAVRLGYNEQECLVRVRIPDTGNSEDLFLFLSHPSINHVEFFHYRGDSLVGSSLTGLLYPLETRELKDVRFVFNLGKETSDSEVFLRFKNFGASLKTKLYLASNDVVFKEVKAENFGLFFFFGGGVSSGNVRFGSILPVSDSMVFILRFIRFKYTHPPDFQCGVGPLFFA